MNCWNDFTKKMTVVPDTTTLQSLRAPSRYWVVSDAQLKRDLKPRTLSDVYRENKVGRGEPSMKYIPKSEAEVWDAARNAHVSEVFNGLFGVHRPRGSIAGEYRKHCEERGHKPHPASLDRAHPINAHIEKAPKVERVNA